MQSRPMKAVGFAAALAVGISSTMAAAATTVPVEPINPLVAVSVYGTPASAQAVLPQVKTATTAGGVAIAAQGVQDDRDPPPPGTDYGINWILLALGLAAFFGGLSTLFIDDDIPDSPS